jgi:flagellar motor protein MotB
LRKALVELGSVLENYQHLIVIEGYTDDQFVPTSQHRTAESLSMSRAHAAAQVLLRGTNISPKTIQLAGLGNKPVPGRDAKNAIDRAANRRVEVRVLSMSEHRKAQFGGGQ